MNTPATHRVSMLEAMLLIRACEEALAARATPTSPGTCTSVGQEASAVGVVRALEPRDRILTNHRSAGHLIARGADTGRLIAEVMGRVDGYCKGKSGTLHISVAELGVILTSTIVGGELSLAPGVALAQKMGQGEAGAITAVFFGDGAACEGIFHEADQPRRHLAAAASLRVREQPVAGLRAAARDDAGRPGRDGRARRRPHRRLGRGPRVADRGDRRQRRRRRPRRRARRRRRRSAPTAGRASSSSSPIASAATSSPTTRPTSIRPSWRAGSRSTRSRAPRSACSTRR